MDFYQQTEKPSSNSYEMISNFVIIKNPLQILNSRILFTTVLLLICQFFQGAVFAERSIVFFHNDIQGSPVAASDIYGNLCWREEYLPYGEKRGNRDADPTSEPACGLSQNLRGYTSHVYDRDIGLTYLQSRFYDPILGRFMGVDPVGFQPHRLASINRYVYVDGNPYKYIDPDGRSPENVFGDDDPDYDDIDRYDVQSINAVGRVGLGGSHANEFKPFAIGGAPPLVLARPNFRSNGVRYGPTNPGPLDARTVATFRGGTYTATVLSETTTLYRVYGGSAGKIGSYWTRLKPSGPLQSQLDSALAPHWGNTAQKMATMKVPKGTTIYEGVAAPQSTGVGQILGGGNQVYIHRVNPEWVE